MSGNSFKTEQEVFWAGEFGTEYIDRNKSEYLLASNLTFFSKSLKQDDITWFLMKKTSI